MPDVKPLTGRHFTPAARLAAKEARRLKKETKLAIDRPEIYVVRGVDDERRFHWQIRRFGGVVLDKSYASFDSMQEAQIAGKHALRTWTARM